MAREQLHSRIGLLLAAVLLLPACSFMESVTPDRRVDYKKAKTTEALEVPPDLTASDLDDTLVVSGVEPSGTAAISDYPGDRAAIPAAAAGRQVLPEAPQVELERDGDTAWLVVQGEPAQVWPRVRDFWLQNGFLLELEDPQIGIMETSWAENRADIPTDPIRSVLKKVIDPVYSAATRDKYRVRLERGQRLGTTEIFLTHRGMEEVVQGTPDEENVLWQPRPSDPELEAEMLKRLMVSLGVQEQRADRLLASAEEGEPRAQFTQGADGELSLTVLEDFSRAWRRTGIALDRIGFAVEDRRRADGVYLVRYVDPDRRKKGFFSKLFSSEDEGQDQYQIQLLAEGPRTQLVVRNEAGERDQSRTAKRILELLLEELK
jgi:outer membrane protein assembly factor BamC